MPLEGDSLGVGVGTAVLAVGVGVLVDGVVGAGVVGVVVGVLVGGVVGAGVVGVVVGVVGVVDGVLEGDVVGERVLADGLLDGVPVVGSAVVGLFVLGPVSGELNVEPAVLFGARGFSGFPTGSDGRALDRDAPSDRSIDGLDELLACGAWPVSACSDLNGYRTTAPTSTATVAAPAPSLNTGGRLRTCRGWGCLKTKYLPPPGRQAVYRLERFNRSSP